MKKVFKSKKSEPIKLTLFDQIPLSVISDITVTATELSRGQLDDKTGKVNWEMNIDPKQQKDIALHYEVKHPRREKVIVE